MAQAGSTSRIVQAVKGSAHGKKEPTTADLSLDTLAARMGMLEQQQELLRLQALVAEEQAGEYKAAMESALREKQKVEEGLRAALEELQKLREKAPLDPKEIAAITADLQRQAATQHKEKLAAWKEKVKGMPKGTAYNPYGAPIPLTINGLTAVLTPGPNTLPKAYVQAWEEHLESEKVAQDLQRVLGGQVEFGAMENIIHGQRALDSTSMIDLREWDEELGAG